MDFYATAVVVPLSILSVFVVVSNVLVCALVFSQRKMRTYTNGFVVSLAISDITIGITMFIQYNVELKYVNNNAGNIIYAVSFICGVANLCAVTYDRYLAVTLPFRYKTIIKKVFKISIPLLWLFSIFVGAVPLLWGGMSNVGVHRIYIVIYLVGFFVVPYILILVANLRIFRLVRRCVQRERQLSISSAYNDKKDTKGSKRNARKMSSEAKVARVFALAAFMFVLSWFPTIFYTAALGLGEFTSVPAAIVNMSPFTIVLGSGINPVLYSFMKPDFRQAIRKIFNQLKNRHNQRAYSLGRGSSLGETSSPCQKDPGPAALLSATPAAPIEEVDLNHPLIETVV